MSTPQTHDQRKKISDAQKAELIRLRNEGWTYRALAERFGISQTHASRIVGEAQ
jgi:transposase-like protein